MSSLNVSLYQISHFSSDLSIWHCRSPLTGLPFHAGASQYLDISQRETSVHADWKIREEGEGYKIETVRRTSEMEKNVRVFSDTCRGMSESKGKACSCRQ